MTLSRNALRLLAGASALALATFGFVSRDGHAPLPERPVVPEPVAPALAPLPGGGTALDAIREASRQIPPPDA